MTFISIKNLNIQYDDHLVLEKFSAKFNQGIHWIQGHNGSGKSSLLKSLCGINPVNPHDVTLMGYDLATKAFKAKSTLCFVADKPDVYPFMTGIQYLKLIAKIRGTKLTQELYDWLDSINLTQFNHTEFSQMSFGTRRKFTLSTVFIGSPQIVLLDEPFNGLDKNTIKKFEQWLAQAKKKSCIVIVSHEPHIIKQLHDSKVLLE